MSLRDESYTLRDVLNNCSDYVVLSDEDVVRQGDETVCASTLLSGVEHWQIITETDFPDTFGRTVRELNYTARADMDSNERLFRTRRASYGADRKQTKSGGV